MRNSKTSYTDNDSKKCACRNMHWDCLQLTATNAHVAAGSATIQPTPAVFPRSKALVRNVPNPNDNEAIVHLIRQVRTRCWLQLADTAIARHQTIFQIRRRPDAELINVLTGNTPIEEIAYEDSIVAPAQVDAFGAAAMTTQEVSFQSDMEFGEFPLVMVRPYSLDFQSIQTVDAAAGATTVVIMYLLVESIRMKGEAYRRLLDHYTQVPTLIER